MGIRHGKPVAGCLQVRRRQIERLRSQVLLSEPAQLLEAHHLGRDPDLTPALLAAGDSGLGRDAQYLNLRLALRLGVVVQPDWNKGCSVLIEIKFLDKILLSLM